MGSRSLDEVSQNSRRPVWRPALLSKRQDRTKARPPVAWLLSPEMCWQPAPQAIGAAQRDSQDVKVRPTGIYSQSSLPASPSLHLSGPCLSLSELFLHFSHTDHPLPPHIPPASMCEDCGTFTGPSAEHLSHTCQPGGHLSLSLCLTHTHTHTHTHTIGNPPRAAR